MTDICTLQLPRGARRAQSNCAETTTCTESTDGRAEVGVGGRDSSGDAIQRPMSRTAQKKARRQRRQASTATDAVATTAEPEPQVELSNDQSDERQTGRAAVPSPMSRTALKKARRQRRKELAAVVANAGETTQ